MEDNSLWTNVGDILSEEGVDGKHVVATRWFHPGCLVGWSGYLGVCRASDHGYIKLLFNVNSCSVCRLRHRILLLSVDTK